MEEVFGHKWDSTFTIWADDYPTITSAVWWDAVMFHATFARDVQAIDAIGVAVDHEYFGIHTTMS